MNLHQGVVNFAQILRSVSRLLGQDGLKDLGGVRRPVEMSLERVGELKAERAS